MKARCRPYYLYNCDLSEGLSHFRTTVEKGLSIMESLYGHTSGYSIPTFVVDAPGGGGKIPLMPNYLIAQHDQRVTLRNYEGRLVDYHEGTPDDHLHNGMCAVCKTDHSSINIGPAGDAWRVPPATNDTARLDPDPRSVSRRSADGHRAQ